MGALTDEGLTSDIIGAAIQVHRDLGPGFLESVYENALSVELQRRGIPHRRQIEVPILYQGKEVGLHRVDLLVSGRVIVELKAVKWFDDIHFVVPRSYLRAAQLRLGLLLNFAGTTLDIKESLHGRARLRLMNVPMAHFLAAPPNPPRSAPVWGTREAWKPGRREGSVG